MFKKLREQVEGGESPKKDDSSRRRSSLPRNRPNRGSGLQKSDSSSSLASISEADVLSGKVSQDDLLSAFMQRTNQLKKLEIKLSDYSQALKESNKEKDKLTNVLEKQQDTAMKRMSELEETYSEGKSSMEKTIAKLEKKEKGFLETIEMLRSENKTLRTSVEKFVKEKQDFEKKRDQFFEKRDDSEELNDLQLQELAKVKHMLMMRERECEKNRLDFDQKVAELLQSQDANEQMEASLRKTTESLNDNVKELEKQILLNEKKMNNLTECRETISRLNVEISELNAGLSAVRADLKRNEAQVSSLESENAKILEKYDSLKHSSATVLSKSNVELDEKQATIDHLQQKISLLENRVTTDKLPESEQVQALIQERASLENKLEESYLQLNNIKSTWSVKINQLEEQVSHLNKKIIEDQEEFNARDTAVSELELSKSREIDTLNGKICELESEIEKYVTSNEGYAEQIAQLEAQLIERSTTLDLEKDKLLAKHENEIKESRKMYGELKAKFDANAESMQNVIDEKKELCATIERLESELAGCKQEFKKAENHLKELESTNESLIQERDGLEKICLERDSKLKILEEELTSSRTEIKDFSKKVASLQTIVEEKSSELRNIANILEEKEIVLKRCESFQASNATMTEEFESKLSALESTVTSREEELIACKTEIATLRNTQAAESDEVATLKAERNKAGELLAERERLIKVQQQRLSDLKKALNKELNKKSASGRADNHRTASPRPDADLNSIGTNHTSNGDDEAAVISISAIDDTPNGEKREINIKYLKHVVLTFLGGSRSEAQQLVKALGTLLSFNREEEMYVKETLEYRGSWFGSKPSTKKVAPRTSRRVGAPENRLKP